MKSELGSGVSEFPDQTPAVNFSKVDCAQHQLLLEIGMQVLSELDVERALTVALDYLIDLTNAEHGMIVLFPEKQKPLFKIARNFKKEDIDYPELKVSRPIIDKVKIEQTPICLQNALEDSTLQHDSCAAVKIFSVLCIPLCFRGTMVGVVYLDHHSELGIFDQETSNFVRAFADFISGSVGSALEQEPSYGCVSAIESELRNTYIFDSIVGHHPQIVEILKLVAKIADTNATVLIHGESGTGKELIARALHYNSNRSNAPFVPINCGALPENLLESELFGHVKGAFTGAIKNKAGWFESAQNGTIFLDEMSQMPPALQVKLLRILQTGRYAPIGSTEIRRCNVRVVAASSVDLIDLVNQGDFREELYYRLNVIELRLPPLRDRKSDIRLLAQHFLKIFGTQYGKKNLRLTRDTEAHLLAHDFPGNVRELENVVQRAVILAEGTSIKPHHLPAYIYRNHCASAQTEKPSSFKTAKQRVVEKFECEYIIDCLKTTQGNISRAATIAGIHVPNFHAKMKKYKIDPHFFKTKID